MDHDINGIAFRVTGIRHPFNGRVANGAELRRDCSFNDLRSLVGTDVPGIGAVLAVGSPRSATLPTGTVLNLVTAGGT